MIRITKLKDLTDQELSSLFNRFGDDFSSVMIETVVPIVNDVREHGDSAVKKYTQKFDRVSLDQITVSDEELNTQSLKADQKVVEAFTVAKENIEEFHKRQLKKDIEYNRDDGSRFGFSYKPIERAAVYVPGGKASYPSSVLMGVIPAKIAGVSEITLVTPPDSEGHVAPMTAAICKMLGVSTILKSGGAQGIAAAGLGTETVSKSDIIVGPGNIFVTAAKTYLFSLGYIQIDSMAGPSEVLVIADPKSDPKWVAWDLLSQAEHEENAVAVLVTTDQGFAEAVNKEIERDIEAKCGRHEIKTAALKNCLTVLVDSIEEAISFSNNYAPEHMQLIVDKPEQYLSQIKNVGSLFLGAYSPVAVGDFISGTNHILPTGGAARFSSGLSVDTFLHRMSWQNISKNGLRRYMPHTNLIAKQEGFDDKHGGSIRVRFDGE